MPPIPPPPRPPPWLPTRATRHRPVSHRAMTHHRVAPTTANRRTRTSIRTRGRASPSGASAKVSTPRLCTPNTESVSTFTAPRARCLVPWSPRSPPTRARPCQPTRTPSGSRRTGSTPWNGSTLRTSRRTPRSPRLVGAGKCAGWKMRSASGARRSWCGRPSGTRTTRWVP